MLLDTSGIFCYHHRPEVQHRQAVHHFHAAPTLLTRNYVVAEFVVLCQIRGLNRGPVLSFVNDLLSNASVEVVWVDSVLNNAAMTLLANRPDKTYSLCDAVSFILLRQRGFTEALTTDRHFEQEGFVRLLV